MTPTAYADVIDYLELRWPDTKTYRNAAALQPDFAALPNDCVWEAARQLYAEGRRMAPTISELLKAATEILRQKPGDRDPWMNDCEAENRDHRWAIVTTDADERIDGIRRTVCALCGAERHTTPRAVPTKSELDARHKIKEPREETRVI